MEPRRKTGGRKKGVPNKVTLAKQQEIAASGLTPLDYMLSVVRDPDAPQDKRLDAAKGAAPYVHPKLAQVQLTGDPDKPLHHTLDMRGLSESTLREIAGAS